MMGRALPLFVDIGVAALTGVGLHEELAGNFLMTVNLGGAREEIALRTVAFLVHGGGRVGGVLNTRVGQPARVAGVPRRSGESSEGKKADRVSRRRTGKSDGKPTLASCPISEQYPGTYQGQRDMQ